MKSTRIKAPAISSRAAFITTIDELARIETEIRQLTAARDGRLQAVRDEHEPAIEALTSQRDSLALSAEKFAQINRDELLPAKAKSAETPLATFGFRLGQPTLKLLNRSWSWDSVLLALRDNGLARLIRKKEEPDKEGIKQLSETQLAAVGCRIDQTETFFVEPKDKPTE